MFQPTPPHGRRAVPAQLDLRDWDSFGLALVREQNLRQVLPTFFHNRSSVCVIGLSGERISSRKERHG